MTSIRCPDFVLLVTDGELTSPIPNGMFDAWIHRQGHRYPLKVGCSLGFVENIPAGMTGLSLWLSSSRAIVPVGEYVTVEYCEEDLESEPPVSMYASKYDGERYFFRALIAQSWTEWHEHKT